MQRVGSSTRYTGSGTGLPSLVWTRAYLTGSRSCIQPAWTWMLLEKQTPRRRSRPSTMMHSLLTMLPFRVNSHRSSLLVPAPVRRTPRALLLLKTLLFLQALPPPHQPGYRPVSQSFQQVLLLLPQLNHQRICLFIKQLQALPPFLQSTSLIPRIVQLVLPQCSQLAHPDLRQCLQLTRQACLQCSQLHLLRRPFLTNTNKRGPHS